MKLDGILPFARNILAKAVQAGDIAVDATAGNGFDTLYLANLVGSNGLVYSFDIQLDAIENSKKRLSENGLLDRVTFFHTGHENAERRIPSLYHGKITAAIFNLGYLPGSDKSIVTTPETTIQAIKQLLSMMAPGGIIVLVVYHGHEQGAYERETLMEFVHELDQTQAHVLRYEFINQKNSPPFIVAIEKRA